MKKIISTILVCALLVCMMFTLASCGKKLNGTYTLEEDGMKLSYTFKKDGTFEGNLDLGILGQHDFEGEYEIDDDEIHMTYELLGEEIDEDFEFEKGKDYIEINGERFDKE